MLQKEWKNIWFWVSILLYLFCVFLYIMANPILWISEAPRTSDPWLTLLAVLCLIAHIIIQRKKLHESIWNCNLEWFAIIIGTYLLFTFYPG